VSRTEFDAMQEALLGMSQAAAGQELLKRLNLDGFVAGDEALFDGIARMMRALDGRA
jgi:phosphonate transport system substrate-binding protein